MFKATTIMHIQYEINLIKSAIFENYKLKIFITP